MIKFGFTGMAVFGVIWIAIGFFEVLYIPLEVKDSAYEP